MGESRRLRTQAERDADRWEPPEPRCPHARAQELLAAEESRRDR